MRKSRFDEAQIIGVLREQEARRMRHDGRCLSPSWDQSADVLPLESQVWRARVSDAQKQSQLDDENRRLKKLLGEAMLDVASLKDLLGKNRSRPQLAWVPCFVS